MTNDSEYSKALERELEQARAAARRIAAQLHDQEIRVNALDDALRAVRAIDFRREREQSNG